MAVLDIFITQAAFYLFYFNTAISSIMELVNAFYVFKDGNLNWDVVNQ